jgi:hypothetical protein
MQLKDDPTIERIRETRHQISEEFNHDPQKIIEYYLRLQEKEETLRRERKQSEEDQLLEHIKA